MGIYTNYTGGGASSHYTEVEPFVGESFNYHELGIVAASEIAANHNSFMKSIALSELAAVEQTGSTDVLYEGVNIKGIFEKIKMFFKKIIEKIHKIFHTFVAKMSSWFGNNKNFAKKYEKEIIKGWANVSNDWEFKGYDYSKITKSKTEIGTFQTGSVTAKGKIQNLMDGDIKGYVTGTKSDASTTQNKDNMGSTKDNGSGTREGNAVTTDAELAALRDKLDDIKDDLRKQIIGQFSDLKTITWKLEIKADASGGYDQTEYTEELFKVFRNGDDSKDDMNKGKIQDCYGGSITAMIAYIKDFDSIKTSLEKSEKNIVKGIDDLIKKMDKDENDLLKETDTNKKVANEKVVQAASFYQSVWGFISECVTQAFSALLQASKDACSQAKEIAVKVIGQSKKMTESYDYGSDSSYDGGFDFISSVKLI